MGHSQHGTPHNGHLDPNDYLTPKTTMTTMTALDGSDLTEVNELVELMKKSLATLGSTFDALGEQTAKVAALGPAIDSANHINQLRRQLHAQERKQEERIREVKTLLVDVLRDQIIEHLRSHVANMIKEQIVEQVKAQVTAQLAEQIPLALKDHVKDHRKQIHDVRRSLHNSEARRANALLKSNNLLDKITPLVRQNGEVSTIFPKNLAATFALGPSSARQLCHEYSLPESDSREANLNKFMHHIGVAFQLVPAPLPSSPPPVITGG